MSHALPRILSALLLAGSLGRGVLASDLDVPASHASLRWEGRTSGPDSGAREMSWSASRVVLRFRGTAIAARIDSGRTWWNVVVDGVARRPIAGGAGGLRVLVEGLADGPHDLVLSKRTEVFVGRASIAGFRVTGASPALLAPSVANEFGIEFVGNSITCGYGLHASDPIDGFQDSTEDADSTASAIAARALGAQYRVTCYSGYGVLRDNSTGPGRLPGIYDLVHPGSDTLWDHARWHPDIVAVNLGTNDFAKSVPDSAAFFAAYANFLRHVVAVHPGVAIALVHGPMIADGFPNDSLGHPILAATRILAHLKRLLQVLRPELGVPMDTIILTTQTQTIGWGGHYHPNPVQSSLNGAELAAGLRRAFPGLLATVGVLPHPADRPYEGSWSGTGPWRLRLRDVRGHLVGDASGAGRGSLTEIVRPRGLAFVELSQDGMVRRFRLATP